MADLEHLKVGPMPAAFSDLGRKHNELVQLIASIEGAFGVDIQITHKPAKKLSVTTTPEVTGNKSRGKIIVGLKPTTFTGNMNAIAGSGGGGGGNTASQLHYNDGTTAIDIDGTNGVLVTKLATGEAAEIFPSANLWIYNGALTKYLKYSPNTGDLAYLNGSNTINFNAAGINVGDGTPNAFSTLEPGHSVVRRDASNYIETFGVSQTLHTNGNTATNDQIGISMQSVGGQTLKINFANITHNMEIRTISVCNGNTAMSMLVLASAPF